MSVPIYPIDRTSCMMSDGPIDPRFQVKGGTLLYNPKRDGRFPYIYQIPSHALVHSPKHITKILIHIVDTSIKARTARADYEKTLSVPLGPDANMDNYGSFLNLISFKILNLIQVCLNWSLALYYLPGPFWRMEYMKRKMIL